MGILYSSYLIRTSVSQATRNIYICKAFVMSFICNIYIIPINNCSLICLSLHAFCFIFSFSISFDFLFRYILLLASLLQDILYLVYFTNLTYLVVYFFLTYGSVELFRVSTCRFGSAEYL